MKPCGSRTGAELVMGSTANDELDPQVFAAENGTLHAVSPEIAKKHLAEMSEEQRAMYEKV